MEGGTQAASARATVTASNASGTASARRGRPSPPTLARPPFLTSESPAPAATGSQIVLLSSEYGGGAIPAITSPRAASELTRHSGHMLAPSSPPQTLRRERESGCDDTATGQLPATTSPALAASTPADSENSSSSAS